MHSFWNPCFANSGASTAHRWIILNNRRHISANRLPRDSKPTTEFSALTVTQNLQGKP